jgi:hypothetical protein
MSLPIFAAEHSLQMLPAVSHPQVAARRFDFSAPTQPRRFQISGHSKLLFVPADRVYIAAGLMSENTCYAMRTYRVERIDKTDSTRPSGYSECLAANKLQLKNATAEK